MPAAPSCHRAIAPLAVSGCLVAALGFATVAAAQTPGVSATRATVYIRLFGDLELVRPADAFGPERRMDLTNVEVSTGSGVLISPIGHVLTAAHVVAPGNTATWKINGESVSVKRTVRRIEVQPPPDDGPAPPVPRLEATVLATDGALDLAVLSVNGSNLPFLDLGDSDALGVGDPVEAVGFPFGDEVELGRASADLAATLSPSISRGNLAAFRGDEQGDRRYLQVTAGLNPGNSGGPIVDADGYVVAIANSVMRSRSGVGAGVGFGVPVNLVKRFLEFNGLDSVLRARRLATGGLSALEGKGFRVAMPIGMSDASPYRSRVDTGQQMEPVSFRVDRVVSPWPAARLEAALVSERAFEPLVASVSPTSQVVDTPGGRLLIGRVSGVMTSPRGEGGAAASPVRMDYAIAERGSERVIARFVGPPYQLAYNASLIRNALRQMEVDPLRSSPPLVPPPAAWTARSAPRGTPLDHLPLPSGWLQEPAGPLPCPGVPAPSDVLSASPAADFAVALRAGWIPSLARTLQATAGACGAPAGDGDTSYSRRLAFLGTSYVVEGRFAAAPDQGVLQMEWIAPAEQAAAMRAIVAAGWPPTIPPASQSR